MPLSALIRQEPKAFARRVRQVVGGVFLPWSPVEAVAAAAAAAAVGDVGRRTLLPADINAGRFK